MGLPARVLLACYRLARSAGCSKGRRFLGSGALLLLLAAAGPDPKTAAQAGSQTAAEIATLAAALAQARSPTDAAKLELELESLRQQSVQPAVRLLVRRGQRELMAGDRRAALSDLDDAVGLQPDNAL